MIRRMFHTARYLGARVLLVRVLTAPLRLTPLRERVTPTAEQVRRQAARHWLRRQRRLARRWQRHHPATVVIVVPVTAEEAREPAPLRRLLASLKATVPRRSAEVLLVGAGDALGELAAGMRVLAAPQAQGRAELIAAGLAAVEEDRDVVIARPGLELAPDWLAMLGRSAAGSETIGMLVPRLLAPDGRLFAAGLQREAARLRNRYVGAEAQDGPENVSAAVLAGGDECLFLTRELRRRAGTLPGAAGALGHACWSAGLRVIYYTEVSLRWSGAASEHAVPAAWDAPRAARTEQGRLRVVYVTEDTGVGGGHRVVFEHANALHERGHDVQLFALYGPPDWFELKVPLRLFEHYDELIAALAPLDAIKVATWWNTAIPVWCASVIRGVPVYFVQDIETSYYPDHGLVRDAVLESYRPEFSFLTTSSWNQQQLAALGRTATIVAPGIDASVFSPRPDTARARAELLAVGRSQPLKNLALTKAAWRRLPEPRPELVMFGIEPTLADEPGMRYVTKPTDEQVAELMASCTAFVQTSVHEGFCLPPLEAMATGAAVVCTDAHGNHDFCRDGENCLMPSANEQAVADALTRVLADEQLRARLGRAGRETAAGYAWPRRVDALEAFLQELAP
ncbi:MAG TPA: glycosyltransferase family 4 protein [Solirubrobacteraceae bacterium]|jgi:glycosyltransferase involved in cell wall biosynthesis|nr:glycosyltransferase family 4 protein [Solirubrobacteraceae bacterium]